jgi:hypothetical protein
VPLFRPLLQKLAIILLDGLNKIPRLFGKRFLLPFFRRIFTMFALLGRVSDDAGLKFVDAKLLTVLL